MTLGATGDHGSWAIPAGALAEWLALSAAIDAAGTVPCRNGDPEAWFPDRKQLDGPSTRLAVHGCWRWPARATCLAYAVAANEREGIWGGLLPEERPGIAERVRRLRACPSWGTRPGTSPTGAEP